MIRLFAIAFGLILATSLIAQQNQPGANNGACNGCPTVQDGSGSLGFIYSRDTCGLNYVAFSQKVGQRFTPPGPAQPITVAVSGIPSCAIIDKAFLWADASGNGAAFSATITNPQSQTNNFPMTLIGQGPDKCWGFQGTDSYRADVTSAITGNGNYVFSGFPVGSSGSDIDGFLLMIIYRDPVANYEGHINIWDGAVVINGGNTSQNITGLNICANSVNQRAFMIVADLQGMGAQLTMNNSAAFTITEDWWNYVDQPTAAFTTAQTSSSYSVSSVGDCYNFMMMGVYYQTTTCNTCTPQAPGSLTLNTTATATCLANSGSVTTNVTGGIQPYTYNWQPGNYNTQTVNGLAPGSYTVFVTDATGCAIGADTVVVPVVPGPVAQFSLSPSPTAFYPGQLCMIDQTNGSASWNWLINGTPTSIASSYCYTIPDTNNICVTLIIQDSIGCVDSANACVEVLGEAIISVPNVFTPNGDGSNDYFEVTWTGLSGLECEIYDRWGVLVYEWNGLTGKWDGKTDNGKYATDGVYYYIITATTTQGEIKKLSGFFHLIRNK